MYFSPIKKNPTTFFFNTQFDWSNQSPLSVNTSWFNPFQAARTRLAVQFTAPGIAETLQEAMPLPAPGEVLVATKMSGKLGTRWKDHVFGWILIEEI